MKAISSYEEYLNQSIEKYFSQVLSKYKFLLVKSTGSGAGAMARFTNDDFILQFTNDRGLLESEAASFYQPNEYLSLASLFILNGISENPGLNSWERKMLLSKILSYEEAAFFIDKQYDFLQHALHTANAANTFLQIKEIRDQTPGQ
jgi:hypothetical protein